MRTNRYGDTNSSQDFASSQHIGRPVCWWPSWISLLLVLLAPTAVQAQYAWSTNDDGTISILEYNGLSGSVSIPDTINGLPVTAIAGYAFTGNIALTNLTLPESVTDIGGRTFEGCTGLVSLMLGDGLATIGFRAFAECTGLKSVILPKGVTNIVANFHKWDFNMGSFADCVNLTNIAVAPQNTTYSSLEGVLYSKSKDTLVTYPPGKGGVYATLDSVTRIGEGAFWGCARLTSVTVSSNVTDIGDSAFFGCGGLTRLSIPDGVSNIGFAAFAGCAGLTNVSIGNGVTVIAAEAFQDCGLTSVIIGNNVTQIGSGAFLRCAELTSVTLPNSLTLIGENAFVWCTSLTHVVIPAGVTNIGSAAFSDCATLTALRVDPLNPSYKAVDGVLFDKAQSTLIQYPGGKVGDYGVPNGVTTIGVQSFSANAQLTNVTIPSSLTNFSSGAFAGCVSLTGLYFQGNAPRVSGSETGRAYGIVYYLLGTTGCGPIFDGHRTRLWHTQMRSSGISFGIRQNAFGFNIQGTLYLPLVVETSTNLALGSWIPLETFALTNGEVNFNDPQWTNYARRFYRIRSP